MRHHPARAMYDLLEDALTSITMQLRSAIEADAGRPGRNGASSSTLLRASGWARQMSIELGSVLLDTLGLAATIEWHIRQFQKCTGVTCELVVKYAAGFDLPEDYAESVFDIYNEALSNVARHAAASRVAISLTITPREVTMIVRDNGIGLSEAAFASATGGLAGMRARSRAYQGYCEIIGTRNAGTTVTVNLPIPAGRR